MALPLSTRFRKYLLRRLIAFVSRLGPPLRDKNGNILCRALAFTWQGNIYLVGVPADLQLRPVPKPQEKLSYWRQAMCWEQATPPDFGRLGKPPASSGNPLVCHVVICHLPAPAVLKIFRAWTEADPDAVILIGYGGQERNFRELDPSINAVFVADPALRTSDHPRERQDYSGVVRAANHWLAEHRAGVTHVHLVEFDAVPCAKGVGQLLVGALHAEDADVAGYGLVDLTGTVHPQNRHQITDQAFLASLRDNSVREAKDRILNMLGCSSIWTIESFREIASFQTGVYLEVALPTLAHHLGYRVRPVPKDQERFVTFEGDLTTQLDQYRSEGAWLVHPCKEFWQTPSPPRIASTETESKPTLLLAGHTYCLAVNREKAQALSTWFDVTVATVELDGMAALGKRMSDYEDTVQESFEVVRFKPVPNPNSLYRSWWEGFGKWLSKRRFDIVLFEAEPWSLSLWQAWAHSALFRRCRLFAEFSWENLERPGAKGRVVDLIYRAAIRKKTAVICGNEAASKIWRAKGQRKERILIAPQLGVGDNYFAVALHDKMRLRQILGLPRDAFIVGFVGRFVPEKGIEDLLDAATMLQSRNPGVHVALLGNGPLKPLIEEKAAASPGKVHLLEPCKHREVVERLQCLDLLVLPSRSKLEGEVWEEQFGHVLIEAMACGVVVLGSDSGAIPEVIGDPELIFPQRNPAALAEIIDRLAGNAKFLMAKREQMLERARIKFSHDAVAKDYADFFKRLLNDR